MDKRHNAQMIVFECKNYCNPIGQNELHQMTQYLQGVALGKFGIISTRLEPSKNAFEARKKAFNDLKVIILFIDDFDYTQMVELKRVTNNPEEYLKRKLEDLLVGF